MMSRVSLLCECFVSGSCDFCLSPPFLLILYLVAVYVLICLFILSRYYWVVFFIFSLFSVKSEEMMN